MRGGGGAPGNHPAGDGRRVRDRNGFGDAAGGELQAHRQAHLPDGADPSPLRIEGLAGAARDRALLDHFGGAGVDRSCDIEGALVLDFFTQSQAVRKHGAQGRYDPWLLAAAIALAAFGVVMVASSSIAVADGQHIGEFYYLKRHVLFLATGAMGALFLMRIELRLMEKFAFGAMLIRSEERRVGKEGRCRWLRG